MKELWITGKLTLTTIKDWLGRFLGNYDYMLYALLIFVILDFVVSMMCAIVKHNFTIRGCFNCMCMKLLIFIMVGISHILDSVVIGNSTFLRTIVILSNLSAEGISLLENASRLGLQIPEPLINFLRSMDYHRNRKNSGKVIDDSTPVDEGDDDNDT